MVKLAMGIWAGIAAGSVMFMLITLPILGCIFSRNKKAKKGAEVEESTAEKGEVVVKAVPAPSRPTNAILQKPVIEVSQYEIRGLRTEPSTQSMTPSSQASTLLPLRNMTPSPPHI